MVLGFAAGSASMSDITLTAPPGAAQVAVNSATVTNSLRDQFTVPATIAVNGQISDFNGGGGMVIDAGPTWVANANWSNSSADYVTRASGSGVSTARVPWLTRRSTVGVTVSSYGTTVNTGVVTGADAAGTSGVAAVLYYSGGYRFGIFRIDGSTATACSTPATLSVTGTRTITITHNPSTGAAATASITGTGGTTITSTCSLSSASGAHAGLYSGSPSTARYDNFSAVL